MKTSFNQLLFLSSFCLLLSNCSSQINLNKITKTVTEQVLDNGSGSTSNPLSNEEVITGLKEALTVGIENGSSKASKLDGFLKNEKIRLPFPEDAQKVKEKALQLGLDKKVKEFETTLNRAAEEAAKEAAPIFISAIKEMSIGDGFEILKGADNAATNYLKYKTSSKLKVAFSPKVENAINKVNLTKYWEPLTSAYNSASFLTGSQEINTDLNEYITNKAIEGLFQLVQEEELKIRKDPIARVTDILKKVFGSL
ncbi:MAG: hypothetical protein CL853_00995 [Crocinitomicaceae bacterium]|nr:hypothetical protein [Crocinitomicaceae bacterium]